MNENRFDEILEYLCSGIMSKKERENVKDEIYDHLMTKFEINLATGMDEETAAESAEKALGNRFVLREKLSKVHSYFPALSFEETAHNYDTLGYDDYILSRWYHIPRAETEERNEEYYD